MRSHQSGISRAHWMVVPFGLADLLAGYGPGPGGGSSAKGRRPSIAVRLSGYLL
jgi:hypothetical protein